MCVCVGGGGGVLIEALVSTSLRFGNFLKPTIGLSVNRSQQSGLLLIMFQLLWIIGLMLRLHGLKLVTMTGLFIPFLGCASSNWSCVYLAALL